MNDYLSKPINPEELAAAVERQLNTMATQPDSGRSSPAAQVVLPTLDMDDLLGRVEGDREILREIVPIFLQQASNRLSLMESAVAATDYQAIILEAHGLKGELANMSAKQASSLARAMEMAAKAQQPDELRALWPRLREEFQRFLKALSDSGLADDGPGGGRDQA
jgi:HPt (histidine-containing phosphotransfer) domain-containing protein